MCIRDSPSGHENEFLGGSSRRFRSPKLTRASGAPQRPCRLQCSLGVGGSGRSPLESADPQVRRAGRRGKLWLERLGKGFGGLGAAQLHWTQELNAPLQIFEELSALITTFPSGLPLALPLSPERCFRSPGTHSELVLTPLLVPGKSPSCTKLRWKRKHLWGFRVSS